MKPSETLAINIKIFKLCANVHLNEKMSKVSWLIVYFSWALNAVQLAAAVVDILFNGLDLEGLAENVPMTMATIMMTYEFYNVIINKENIEKLLGLLEQASKLQVRKIR